MAKVNVITVFDNERHPLLPKLSGMGLNCAKAPNDKTSFIRNIIEYDVCAIAADTRAIDAAELEYLLGAVDVSCRCPVCIVVTGDSAPFEKFSFVHCFSELPSADIVCKIISDAGERMGISGGIAEEARSLERTATEIIQKMGIPANVKGYRYLRNAVMVATKDMSILDSVTKQLYPIVAMNNNTTPARVERAIRHAISAAWDRRGGDVDYIERKLHCKFDYSGVRPTNSELIALISDSLRLFS